MKEKTLRIQNREVHYKIAGEGPAIFILHGWGRGSDSWAEVQEKLAEAGYKVIVPDLPGFGKTSPPETIWGVKEYADFAMEFIKKLGADTFFLLGHSFGGQVAVKFAASYPEKLEKLILCAPAAIRKEPGLKEVFITYVAKMGNFVLFFIPIEGLRQFARNVFARIIGRSDYLQAPGIMRKVMQKVIREDLSTFFSQIGTDTLFVWGEKDRPVPVEDAYVMQKSFPSSSLEIILGAGHRIHREVPKRLVQIIVSFLK